MEKALNRVSSHHVLRVIKQIKKRTFKNGCGFRGRCFRHDASFVLKKQSIDLSRWSPFF